MINEKAKNICWALSIPRNQESKLRDLLGSTVNLVNWTKGFYPEKADIKKDNPIIIFSSPDSEMILQRLPLEDKKNLSLLPKSVLLPDNYSANDMDLAISTKPLEILKPDFSKKELWNLLLKAHEAQNIHKSIQSMTRELLLERDLLEQKNELMSFLVSFFSCTVEDIDYAGILSKAFEPFAILLPVRSMHAVIWHKNIYNETEAQFFLNSLPNTVEHMLWKEILIKEMINARNGEKDYIPGQNYRLPLKDGRTLRPESSHYYTLPLEEKGLRGLIILVGEKAKSLGKNQTESLILALKHLGQVLSNSQLFSQARREADMDALTNLNNRRHFEQKIKEEMLRSQRYEHPLGLLMLDIDHFKKINDSCGHHSGDIVLKELASILKKELRSTDYCARYGGEEFSVLMPMTDEEQSFMVAERLRLAIATHAFPVDVPGGRVTASIGLAHSVEKNFENHIDFTKLADERLYEAKETGRNRTSIGKLEIVSHVV